MTGSVIIKSEPDGIRHLTLYRPEKRNALNIGMMESLCFALDDAEKDASVRVIVLSGAPPVFCAGLDLAESADPDVREVATGFVARLLQTLAMSRKPSIAAVQGAALAGGAGLMSACDLVVAEEDVFISYPEVRRGLPAALVMCLLRRQVPERHAKELLLLADRVPAQRALDMGLINRIVEKGQALETSLAWARLILKGGPEAVAHTKRMLHGLWPRPIEEDLAAGLKEHGELRGSDEAWEGLRSFNEKRLPKWDPEA